MSVSMIMMILRSLGSCFSILVAAVAISLVVDGPGYELFAKETSADRSAMALPTSSDFGRQAAACRQHIKNLRPFVARHVGVRGYKPLTVYVSVLEGKVHPVWMEMIDWMNNEMAKRLRLRSSQRAQMNVWGRLVTAPSSFVELRRLDFDGLRLRLERLRMAMSQSRSGLSRELYAEFWGRVVEFLQVMGSTSSWLSSEPNGQSVSDGDMINFATAVKKYLHLFPSILLVPRIRQPSMDSLTDYELAVSIPSPEISVELTTAPTHADGITFSPEGFAWHDAGVHGLEVVDKNFMHPSGILLAPQDHHAKVERLAELTSAFWARLELERDAQLRVAVLWLWHLYMHEMPDSAGETVKRIIISRVNSALRKGLELDEDLFFDRHSNAAVLTAALFIMEHFLVPQLSSDDPVVLDAYLVSKSQQVKNLLRPLIVKKLPHFHVRDDSGDGDTAWRELSKLVDSLVAEGKIILADQWLTSAFNRNEWSSQVRQKRMEILLSTNFTALDRNYVEYCIRWLKGSLSVSRRDSDEPMDPMAWIQVLRSLRTNAASPMVREIAAAKEWE